MEPTGGATQLFADCLSTVNESNDRTHCITDTITDVQNRLLLWHSSALSIHIIITSLYLFGRCMKLIYDSLTMNNQLVCLLLMCLVSVIRKGYDHTGGFINKGC